MSTSYKIQLTSDPTPPVIELAQGTDAVNITFQITDWSVPAGTSARIYVKKPSGLEIYNSCLIDEGSGDIIAEITTQMTAELGFAEAQLNLSTGGKVANSFIFYFDIKKSIIDADAIQSTSEYTALQGLINDAQEAIAEAWDAASEANSAVSNYFVKADYSYSSGVHTLTLPVAYNNANTIYFIPTVSFTAGDVLRIKRGSAAVAAIGAQTWEGEELPDGAWKAGAAVLCIISAGTAYFPINPQPDPVERETQTVQLTSNAYANLVKVGSHVDVDVVFPGGFTNATPTEQFSLLPDGWRPGVLQTTYVRGIRNAATTTGYMIFLLSPEGVLTKITSGQVDNTWTFYAHFSFDAG